MHGTCGAATPYFVSTAVNLLDLLQFDHVAPFKRSIVPCQNIKYSITQREEAELRLNWRKARTSEVLRWDCKPRHVSHARRLGRNPSFL
jgi:hypothetical protein